MCGHTKQSLTWHFLLSGLCTGAGRDTPEAHWWTRQAACGLTVEVRMWTRSAGWSATGLRISVLGVGADWSCWARLERSGGHDWLRKCFSGTLWMQKERKVSLSQSGLSEEEEISRREAIIQQQHSLPSQRGGLWPPGHLGEKGMLCTLVLLLESPGCHFLSQPAPLLGGAATCAPGVWLWPSSKGSPGAVSTTAFLLFGGSCHHLPQS